MSNAKTQEIYDRINSRFLDALKNGTAPWRKPWVGELSAPRNLQSGKRYRGINSVLLGMSGYSDPRWTTYSGAQKMGATSSYEKATKYGKKTVYVGGGSVRKDEKGTLITLWKRLKVKDANAPDGEKIIPMLRYFIVFNVEQCDFPEGAIPALSSARPDDWDAIAEAENAWDEFLLSDGSPSIGYGGNAAYYQPATHHIQMPNREDFTTAEGFYSTAFHEGVHSTARELGRELSGKFGSSKYSNEELIAEMGACFVLANLGIEPDYDSSAAYFTNWAKRLEEDPKLIVKVAGQAQKAADRILGVTFESDTDTSVEKEAV